MIWIKSITKEKKNKTKEGKDKKQNTFAGVNALYESRELTLNAFRSGTFQIKEKEKDVQVC